MTRVVCGLYVVTTPDVRMLESSQLSVERLKSKLEKQQLQRLSEREEELRSATF